MSAWPPLRSALAVGLLVFVLVCAVAACGSSSAQDCGTPVDCSNPACRQDDRCAVCGDGVASGPEDCDRSDLRGKTCADFGFDSGQLACNAACVYDLRGCATIEICDNGKDDDGNGLVDCADPGCADSPNCEVCGDGVITGDEQCEDDTAAPGTCCDATCHAAPGCEIEPNDATTTAQVLTVAPGGKVGIKGFIEPAGDLDVYAIAIPPGNTGKITAEVTGGAFTSDCYQDLDSYLEVLQEDGSLAATDDDSGAGTCSMVEKAGLAPGFAYVRVSASPVGAPSATFDYQLAIHLELEPCGDGIVQEGQECDDGNTVNGDGCSSACQLEPIVEVEPDDDQASANGPFHPPFAIAGTIDPSFMTNVDSDWYSLDLTAPAYLRVEAFDRQDLADCSNIIADVSLYSDDNGTAIPGAVGSPGTNGDCSLIDTSSGPAAAELPAGRYYVVVDARPAPGQYKLYVTLAAAP